MVSLNVPVIRLRPNSKIPLDMEWQNLATTDSDQIAKWDEETPNANCGSVAKSDGILIFESDEPNVIKKYQDETGEVFPKTFTVQSRPGRFHFYFLQTEASRQHHPEGTEVRELPPAQRLLCEPRLDPPGDRP
jgi:hypothetical protein